MQSLRQTTPLTDNKTEGEHSGGEHLALHDLLTRAFDTERDAAVLNATIAALGQVPESASANAAETYEVIARLRKLAAHPDANVRGAALCALATWDRSATVEDYLCQGLADSAQPVRQAAITAAGHSSIRSERLKETLLDTARAPTEEASIKVRAAALLSHDFSLTGAEHNDLNQIQLKVRATMVNRSRALR